MRISATSVTVGLMAAGGALFLGCAPGETPSGDSRAATVLVPIRTASAHPSTQAPDTSSAQVLTATPAWSERSDVHVACPARCRSAPLGKGAAHRRRQPHRLRSTAELHDPHTGTWSPAAASGLQGNVTSGVLLPNGKALVLADGSPSGRVFDPDSGTWSTTGAMASTRSLPTLTLLHSGKVLVAGGAGAGGVRLTTAELYDPDTNAFTPTGSMAVGRGAHAAALLRDGRVLVVSGFNQAGEVPSAELYDPATGDWSSAASVLVPRHYAGATLLPDGRVLVSGGFGQAGGLPNAELYDPVEQHVDGHRKPRLRALRTHHDAAAHREGPGGGRGRFGFSRPDRLRALRSRHRPVVPRGHADRRSREPHGHAAAHRQGARGRWLLQGRAASRSTRRRSSTIPPSTSAVRRAW